jgi:hypothetical protein
MLRKIFLVFLVMLTPVQAWAVLDMGMQKMHAAPVSQMQESVAAQHSMDSNQVIEVSGDRCFSCTLCMAFGLLPNSVGLMVADRYSQTFHTTLKTLMGIDSSVVIRPPIL